MIIDFENDVIGSSQFQGFQWTLKIISKQEVHAVGSQIAIFPIAGLELGTSGDYGKWDDQNKNKTFVVGSHLIYDINTVGIRAEYLFLEIGNATSLGFYIQAVSSA